LNKSLVNFPCQRIQCDEIWSFCYAEEKNVTPEIARRQVAGDVWTWVAMDADTKLICSWLVGQGTAKAADQFIMDLRSRLANRVQLTTDGLAMYLTAVAYSFGQDVDYAQLVKIYGDSGEDEKRYSPAECTGCENHTIVGNPDPKHISTSYIERQNLTMRMQMRRFTRLTNAFSKKIENHIAAIALHYMHYNFCRIHQTLRITSAMASGIADRVWTIRDLLSLLV
jgi:IS1 family transposase